jgi:hypothetical protein
MARLPSFKRIVGDLIQKDYPELRDVLVVPLNNFMESITRALNNRITFGENFDGQVFTTQDSGQYPIKLNWTRPTKPIAVWLGSVLRSDGAEVTLANAVSLNWFYNQDGQIEIIEVLGLSASSADTYDIVIIGVAG